MKNKFVWIAVGIALAGWFGFSRWKTSKAKAPVFRTMTVEKGDLQVTVLATGMIQPQNRLEIKPPIAGRTEEILVREGQYVKKGQILAWMSSSERAALLDAARAKGPAEVAHWQDLYKPTPLVAPLSGTIIARNVEPGQTLGTADPVLVMSDRLIVKAQVDETDIGRIALNQKATITLDAYPDEPVQARVDHIAFEAQTVNNVTIYEVDVLPEKVPAFMRSGMTANVVFRVAEKTGVLLLPLEAVRQNDGKSTVMVPNPSGKKRHERREVVTGLSDGKKVEIVSGLEDGETVLTATLRMPRSGGDRSSVNPLSPTRQRRRN